MPSDFKIMGIVNITPDSFSDGGRYFDSKSALKKAVQLIEYGADIIDFGAESTRPGAAEVSVEAEWNRLGPVLKEICTWNAPAKISIDTRNRDIIRRGIDLGVSFINNVSGLADDDTLKIIASQQNVSYIAMHMHQKPATMQKEPLKASEITHVIDKFSRKTEEDLLAAGFSKDRVWIDPGIGFGKTVSANLKILAHIQKLTKKYNVAIGVSRKSWIGKLLDIESPDARDVPTKMAELFMIFAGVGIIRTHDVKTLSKIRSYWREE